MLCCTRKEGQFFKLVIQWTHESQARNRLSSAPRMSASV